MFTNFGEDFWNNAILINPQIESEFLPQYIKLVPLILTLLGGFLAYYSTIL